MKRYSGKSEAFERSANIYNARTSTLNCQRQIKIVNTCMTELENVMKMLTF